MLLMKNMFGKIPSDFSRWTKETHIKNDTFVFSATSSHAVASMRYVRNPRTPFNVEDGERAPPRTPSNVDVHPRTPSNVAMKNRPNPQGTPASEPSTLDGVRGRGRDTRSALSGLDETTCEAVIECAESQRMLRYLTFTDTKSLKMTSNVTLRRLYNI